MASALPNWQNCTCACKTLQTQRGRTHGVGCVWQWFCTTEPLGERCYENWNTHTHTLKKSLNMIFIFWYTVTGVTGRFGPIPVRTPGRFGPIPFRPGRFGLGRFGPILEVGRFGLLLVGHFGPLYFIYFLGNKKFFLLARLI